MTTASPTPLAASSLGNGRFPRQSRQSVRPAFSSMRQPTRRHSPLSLSHGDGFSADVPALQQFSIGDSSDDDDVPKPMNFSALTKALLEDRAHPRQSSPHRVPRDDDNDRQTKERPRQQQQQQQPLSRAGTPSAGKTRVARKSPPPVQDQPPHGSPPRVVHLSASKNSSGLRRAASTLERSTRSRDPTPLEYITPAPHPPGRLSDRSRANSESSPAGAERAYSGSAGHASGGSSQFRSQHASSGSHASGADPAALHDHDSDVRAKSRNGADSAVPNSMRLKRVPMGSGTFLKGAPVRRGIIRRHSEDDQSPEDDDLRPSRHADDEHLAQYYPADPSPPARIQVHDFARDAPADPPREAAHESRHSDARQRSESRGTRPSSPANLLGRHSRRPSMQSLSQQQQPVYRVPAPLPGSHHPDQENEPPPTFKRNKPQTSGVLVASDKPSVKLEDKVAPLPAGKSPKRQPLQALSQNTPLRPAPPPPKMSVLETATANAGASTVKSKKKRSHVIINNKVFTIRGRIGKGGSSDVYRVMAENDKMFALKKVNLEDCNEETVRGYKGEIDLLKKLENVDRVVRLFDWEINEQKQSLSVLMEIGESDLNKLLASRLHPENARLDLNFTRHYWREMLRCVAAVHAHDIVHSDLKPANFLLVCGRLKLIDFGIANAIDTENTVNVHRETNVGTPNYMSPESLQDTNAGTESRVPGGGGSSGMPKLMKLGKPSDIWSLGCILYQMTYGKPPFAHIANQWNRVCAIINPSVQISFPTHGIGDVFVPWSLRRLLQRCLDRDLAKRPTMGHLLGESEAFLNPDLESDGAIPMTEALLGQILLKVVQRCKDPNRGFPSEGELLRTYPKGYMDNIRAGLERG